MKRPQRKDYPSHQAWVSAMDKFNAAKPKRKDYKSHADWVTAIDAFNKKGKPVKKTNSVEKTYSRNKKRNPKSNVDLKVKKDLPSSKETSASIRANQKKNDKKVVSSSNNASSNNNSSNNNKPKNTKLKIKSTTKGGPVKSGVEYARSKGDDLAGYRRTKDTRITKKLKKAGFTEDRLARLRKQHAEFKAKRKKKKKV